MKLHDLSSEEMLRGVGEGRLHLSLMARPSERALRGLKFELLREYPICVAMPPKHRLARGKTVALEQIADEPLVVYSRAEYPEYHAMLAELFAEHRARTRLAEEHDSAPSLIAAAEIGRGLGHRAGVSRNPCGRAAEIPPVAPVAAADPVGRRFRSATLDRCGGQVPRRRTSRGNQPPRDERAPS